MLDKDFLKWLAERLVYVYGESPNLDIVHKLRAVAAAQPAHIDSEWLCAGC